MDIIPNLSFGTNKCATIWVCVCANTN